MVEFATPQLAPLARPAGQVGSGTVEALSGLAESLGQAADGFSEYFEEKAAINNERLLFETQETWQQNYNEAVEKKAIGPGFAEGFMDRIQADIDERMKAAPERGRDRLTLALDKWKVSMETAALKAEAAARARAAAAGRAAAKKAAADARRMRGNTIVSDPEFLATAIEQDPDGADYYTKLALSTRIMDDPLAVADEIEAGNWDVNLTPAEKLTFMKQGDAAAERMQREADAALEVKRREYESALEEELAFAEANGAPPVDSAFNDAALDILYGEDPERRAEVERVYTEGVAVAEIVNSIGTASPDQIRADFEGFAEKVREPGHTKEDVANLNRFVAAVEQRDAEIAEDPAAYAIRNSEGLGRIYELYGEATDNNRASIANSYMDTLDVMYDRLGVPDADRRVLPGALAKQTAAMFNGMAPDAVAASLVDYMGQWGDAKPEVMAELQAAKLAPEYAVAMRHWDDPGLAAEIVALRGQSEGDLKEGLPSTNVTDMRRELDETLADYRAAFEAGDITGAAVETFNLNYGVATRLALKYMRTGMDPGSAAETVTDRLFPETPINEPHTRVVVPEGFKVAAVEAALDRLRTADALRSWGPLPLDDPRLPEFADLEVLLASAEDQGVWLNNATGDGAVLHIDVGGYLLPITNKDGAFYEMPFSDAATLARPPTPGSWILGR